MGELRVPRLLVSTSTTITEKIKTRVIVHDISSDTLVKSLDLSEEDVGKILHIEKSDILLIEQSTINLNYEETLTTLTENISDEQRKEIEQKYNFGIIHSKKPSGNKENNIPLPFIILAGTWVSQQLWDIAKGLIINYTYEKYKPKNDIFINVRISQFYKDSNSLKMFEYNGKIEDINCVYEKMKETFVKKE